MDFKVDQALSTQSHDLTVEEFFSWIKFRLDTLVQLQKRQLQELHEKRCKND